MQPEAKIVKAIKKMIKERGGFCFKVWGSEYMMAGLPDLIICYRGRFVAMEVKTAIGEVSARQRYVHGLIERAGGVVDVPRSVDDASNILDIVDVLIETEQSSQT